jgi:hypothetical protein
MKTKEIGKLESGEKDPCFDCELSDSPNCSSCEDYGNYRQRWEVIKRIPCKKGEVPFQEIKGRFS